jgi:glucoamylase
MLMALARQPWYLTTFGVAEQLYHSLNVWNAQGSLEITPVSLSFFRQFSPSVGEGKYVATSRDRTFETLTRAIRIFADDFIAVNARYTPSDGALAEQYSKKDGSPLSAAHLTWSYASSLTAFAARKGTEVKSWGAKGLVVPRVCVGNPGPQVTMIFNVEANTRFGGEACPSFAPT